MQIRALTEHPTAVRRALLGPDQVAGWVPSACSVVAEHLRHHAIAPAGYPFARCHPLPDGLVAVEAGFPVDAPIADTDLVGSSMLPGGPALAVWHTAPYEKVELAYQPIDEWLRGENAIRAGDSWEVYHDLPTCDDLGNRIEVVQPIAFSAAVV